MSRSYVPPYHTRSAVLFLIFNRPDTTQKVFEQIRKAKPRRLYVAADGPRIGIATDGELCRQAREIISGVNWDCELKTNFRTVNAGLKDNVSSAVTWFFEHEEEGIILEDDCLPANSFFKFCDAMLKKYRGDHRVRHIAGCNFQNGIKRGCGSYYFSNRVHVWGWASWRWVWKDYDKYLTAYREDDVREKIWNIYPDPLVVDGWVEIFKKVKTNKVDSWAYPLDFINFFYDGLVVIPNENLISNIGFGTNATHPASAKSEFDHLPLSQLDEFVDPGLMIADREADLYIINREFGIEEKRRKQKAVRYKLKNWVKSLFNNAAL